MNIWYDILFTVNSVSKTLLSKDIHIDVAINQLKGLITYLKNYRENEFVSTLNSTKEIANEMGIESIFHENRKIHRKKHFDENNDDEITHSSEKTFRIDYFLFIIDKFILSIESRFEQLMAYKKVFDFLFDLNKLKSLCEDESKNYYLNLETFLCFNDHLDIDRLDLFFELKMLKYILNMKIGTLIKILNHIKKIRLFFKCIHCLWNITNNTCNCCDC